MVIHLHDRKAVAVGLVLKLEHALAGFPMLFLGIRHFSEEGELPIAVLEIVIAALVLGTFARHAYAAGQKHAHHSRVDWFDLAAAAMMLFEAFHGPHHKPPYATPQFWTAVTLSPLALFHGKLHAWREKRGYVKLDQNGVEVRTSRFRRFSVGWAELDRIHIGEHRAVFHRSDGKQHTIGFRMLGNHDEVRKHLSDHARAAGVSMETVS
jgi:hypothetical protein